MFKNHPKGLIPAALANMGERFGFYVMMAILVLFLTDKFNLEGQAAVIYSVFYALIYVLALIGGLIADKTRKYKATILAGLITMSLGYLLMALPTATPPSREIVYSIMGFNISQFALLLSLTCFGLFTIAFGNGLFKGNLQAVVGQLYDNEKYSKYRDSGFSLFYMFINVGAIFAPIAAVSIRNWWVSSNGFIYNASLPKLSNGFLSGTLNSADMTQFQELAIASSKTGAPADLTEFATNYLNVFTTGYHFAFALAIAAMLISVTIYLINKKSFPDPSKKNVGKDGIAITPEIKMEAKEVRQRIWALMAVYAVVIFFWFSFHQNGLTLTYFARDYTSLSIGSWNFGVELFQSINPFFVVFLTPVVLAFFGWLRSRGKEPTTPTKIAIGMGIAALAYLIMVLGTLGLPARHELGVGGLEQAQRVTPLLLITTYFILTVAELFISPLGISFVSKVAPPKYQGLMQGGWLCATAVGNQFLFIGAIFYNTMSQTVTWGLFVTVCLLSMTMMLFMLRWLNKVAR